ncbi:hypothetical protein F5Y01DRAFT_241715 [Xylaria sp. FL0043]|nr:hypothetical protein F5Y01DRAFT_241715 [Xylaria sp. FL0043]
MLRPSLRLVVITSGDLVLSPTSLSCTRTTKSIWVAPIVRSTDIAESGVGWNGTNCLIVYVYVLESILGTPIVISFIMLSPFRRIYWLVSLIPFYCPSMR